MRKESILKEDIIGKRFGKLVVVKLSNRRGRRGKRTVPLWECVCDCGKITYKATDVLSNESLSMCSDCAKKYATEKMRDKAGFVNGTQISRIKSNKIIASNTSGARGVYLDKRTGKWRARLKFKGKTLNFGSYVKFEDAVKARELAEEEYFEKFLEELNLSCN